MRQISSNKYHPPNMIWSTRCAGAIHTEGMESTILSTTMDHLATTMCQNTQKVVEDNHLNIPNTHQPTMFSKIARYMYYSLPENTQSIFYDTSMDLVRLLCQRFKIYWCELHLWRDWEKMSSSIWEKMKTETTLHFLWLTLCVWDQDYAMKLVLNKTV